MTLERLLSFYKHSNPPRYAARISRPIITRRGAKRFEREPRVLREWRLFKLRQTCDSTPRTRVSRLTELRLSSKKRSASPPWSLRHFNKVTPAFSLWRLRLFSILCLASWQNKRAASLFLARPASLLWSKLAFGNAQSRVPTSSERRVFTLKKTHTLAKHQRHVSSTMKSPHLYLEVCVTSTKWELHLHFDVRVSPMSGSHISTSDEVPVSKTTWPLRLQDLCSVFWKLFNSILVKADDYSPNSTIHPQQVQSTEDV